jgi:tetratricopeptide (TPR) repeat protein
LSNAVLAPLEAALRHTFAVAALCSTLAAPAALACGNALREHQIQMMGELRAAHDARQKDLKERLSENLDRANAAYARGEYQVALEASREVLELEKLDPVVKRRARKLGGQAALKLQRWAEAVRHLEPLDNGPDASPFFRARLAEAMANAGQRDKALRIFFQLRHAELMPDADAWVALARLEVGNQLALWTAIEKALERDPSHKGALALRAQYPEPPEVESQTPSAAALARGEGRSEGSSQRPMARAP